MFEGGPHRGQQRTGGSGTGHGGEAGGLGYIIHMIPCPKFGELRDNPRISANPPRWCVPPSVYPGQPTVPRGSTQLLPGEGSHCHGEHKYLHPLYPNPRKQQVADLLDSFGLVDLLS